MNQYQTIIKSVLIIILIIAINQSMAQGDSYQVKRHSFNNGGSSMTGGSYQLKSSIGQTDASSTLSGGIYNLNGGFWQQNQDLIFNNNFE